MVVFSKFRTRCITALISNRSTSRNDVKAALDFVFELLKFDSTRVLLMPELVVHWKLLDVFRCLLKSDDRFCRDRAFKMAEWLCYNSTEYANTLLSIASERKHDLIHLIAVLFSSDRLSLETQQLIASVYIPTIEPRDLKSATALLRLLCGMKDRGVKIPPLHIDPNIMRNGDLGYWQLRLELVTVNPSEYSILMHRLQHCPSQDLSRNFELVLLLEPTKELVENVMAILRARLLSPDWRARDAVLKFIHAFSQRSPKVWISALIAQWNLIQLVRDCVNDTESFVRASAIECFNILGIDDDDTLLSLLFKATSDGEAIVRRVAYATLAKSGQTTSGSRQLAEVEWGGRWVSEPDSEVRSHMLECIAAHAPEKMLRFTQLASRDESIIVRSTALELISEKHLLVDQEMLSELRRSTNPDIMYYELLTREVLSIELGLTSEVHSGNCGHVHMDCE